MIKKICMTFFVPAFLLVSTSAMALHSDRKCDSCHIPHKAEASNMIPLWMKATGERTYTPYSSRTLDAVVGQPRGQSKMCLGCHGRDTGSKYHLGLNLKDDHPVSFTYDSTTAATHGYLEDPSVAPSRMGAKSTCTISSSGRETCTVTTAGSLNPIADDLLRPEDPEDYSSPKNQLECTSCHDVHNKLNIYYESPVVDIDGNPVLDGSGNPKKVSGKYLQITAAAGYMCKVCHNFGLQNPTPSR